MKFTDIKRNLSILPVKGDFKKIILMIALRNFLSIGLNENFSYVADSGVSDFTFDGILLESVNFDEDDDKKIRFTIHPFKNFEQVEASFYEFDVESGEFKCVFGLEIEMFFLSHFNFYEVLEIIDEE